MSVPTSPVQVTFIHKKPPCKKCLKAKAVVEDAIKEADVPVDYREVIAGTPDSAQYGAVFSPMVLVAGSVAAAGFVPLQAGLVKLIRRAAAGES